MLLNHDHLCFLYITGKSMLRFNTCHAEICMTTRIITLHFLDQMQLVMLNLSLSVFDFSIVLMCV